MQVEPCTASNKSSSAAIVSRAAMFIGVTLVPAAADCSVTIYDNTAGSGTVIGKITGLANAASTSLILNIPVMCTAGIYATLAGTGATCTVYFTQSN